MIIRQTTTIVFEYPQDYLQEQEWCKTKTDEWIHVGQDTRCSIYENKISYCIGQPKDEPQTNADQHVQRVEYVENVKRCRKCKHIESEHQTPVSADGKYYTYVVCTVSECRFEPTDEQSGKE